MTPEHVQVVLAGGALTVPASWAWAFIIGRRQRRAPRPVSPPRPAGAPPRLSDPAVDRAFTLAHVAAVSVVLERPPTDQLYREFALAADEAVERRRRMLAAPGR